MDLIDRIKDSINRLELPMELTKGALQTEQPSLMIYPLSGSRVIQRYMDGAKDADVHFEIAMYTKDSNQMEKTLWDIQHHLDHTNMIESKDDSFTFNHIEITSTPFHSKLDETGELVFRLTFSVNVTTKEEK